MKHLFIGIDIGTSSAKLVLIDEAGFVINQAGADYQVDQPQTEWSEINPDIWFCTVMDCMKRLLAGAERDKVAGIGVTGQMHTVAFIDEHGESVRPALMWTDKRTKEYIPHLKEQINRHAEISYIANIISTGSPAANLYWLRENEPEHFRRLHKFLIGPDFIVFRLTGVYGTEYCEASTSSLFDLQNKRWSESMRQIIGLPESVYPKVKGSAEIAGKLRHQVALELGLREDVNVIAGTGDNPAAAITTGCLVHGYPVISLGTSGVLMLSREQLNFDAKGKNILFSLDGNTFFCLVQGTVQSTGSSLMWWMRDMLQEDDMSEVDTHIDIETAGRSPVIFYPHIQGDKTLYADPNLSGAFIGLRAETTRWDMAFAVMEGICFGFRELADNMRFSWDRHDSIRVAGGGSKSDVWMQTMADVLNIPIDQLDGTISASYGMALLAAYSCGSVKDIGEASDKVMSVRRRFIPRPQFRDSYDRKFTQYLRIHDALVGIKGEV